MTHYYTMRTLVTARLLEPDNDVILGYYVPVAVYSDATRVYAARTAPCIHISADNAMRPHSQYLTGETWLVLGFRLPFLRGYL